MNEKELVGVTLGSSTIERLIGRGGMALVFLAQQARPTRTVAVKVLLDTQNSSPDQQRIFLERFRREADTAAKLEHKNILPIYEYAEALINGQQLAYLVMPYIRGGSLRQRIDEQVYQGTPFDLSTVSSYISQIAEALSYAHSLGVVHRDVKPGNLLFHSDGRLLLTDFGIVRLSTMPSLTMVGSFIGTVEYASPEQVSGSELDARSDIYSLGIILYELLIGHVPFTGSTPFEIMARHLHDPVPSVRNQRPDLSPSIEFVVKKALAKDPKDRYQHALELAADLQAAVKPALAQHSGLRLSGDANNSDLTEADGSQQPPAQPLIFSAPMAAISRPDPAGAAAAIALPPTVPGPVQTPLSPVVAPQSPGVALTRPAYVPLPPMVVGAGAAQIQVAQMAADLEEGDAIKISRPSRRIYFYVVGLICLGLQFVILSLTLSSSQGSGDISAPVLGILLGNALNLFILATIAFTAVTRQRDLSGVFNRSIWVTTASLVLSGFFISYGTVSPNNDQLYLPLVSYLIMLASFIFMIRQLSKVDAGHEQVEVAPVAWRAAFVGALTGLFPLVIILAFVLLGQLPWADGHSPFLRVLIPLVIAFIGSPTPGAMMAVWLSRKMSFPILIRTSAIAGLFMFLTAYILVVFFGLLTGKLFAGSFAVTTQALAVIITGVLFAVIGLLRGQLDAWIYHRVLLRRRA
ncbi:MAG TPA: serine/threonine-protein kinase [Ktedonobacteraceae bacterium]